MWTFHDMWPILDTEHLNYSGIKTKNNFIANFINKKIRNQKKKYLYKINKKIKKNKKGNVEPLENRYYKKLNNAYINIDSINF